MTVSVVFAIAGVIALLFGIVGGGIKAKEIEVPFLPVRARVITIVVGLVLISMTIWLENKNTSMPTNTQTPEINTATPPGVAQTTPSSELASTSDVKFNVFRESVKGCTVVFNGVHIDQNHDDPLSWEWGDGNFTQGYFPQTYTYAQGGAYSVAVTAPSGLTRNLIVDVDCQPLTLVPSANGHVPSENLSFSLQNSQPGDFYTMEDGTFLFLENGNLAIAGEYAGGTYINRPLPRNFRATIQFTVEHPEDEFILGLSDGKEMRPNYHLVMRPTGIFFKQQLGFDIKEEWDKYLKSVDFEMKPNNIYEVILERRNGGINIFVNNVFIMGLGAPDVASINSYEYLYLTGPLHQQVIIKSLTIGEPQQ